MIQYGYFINSIGVLQKYIMRSDYDIPKKRQEQEKQDRVMRTCQIKSCYFYDDCIKVPIKGVGIKCVKYKHKLHL